MLFNFIRPCRLPKSLASFLICTLLSNCSLLQPDLQNKPVFVERLITDQQFYLALDVIDKTVVTDPSYTQLSVMRKEVLVAIERYEEKNLDAATVLTKQGRWGDAIAKLDLALTNVPASKRLMSQRKKIQKTIDQRMEGINLALAILRSKILIKEKNLLMESQRYFPNESNALSLQQREEDAKHARSILLTEAKRMIKNTRWKKARYYADLSRQLRVGKDTKKLLKKIDSHIYQEKVSFLKQALEKNELILAKQLASDLDNKDTDPEVNALIEALNQKVEVEVSQLVSDGQQAYSNGNIDQAIGYWQQALELDTSNSELQKGLQRAITFKSNYQRLKQN